MERGTDDRWLIWIGITVAIFGGLCRASEGLGAPATSARTELLKPAPTAGVRPYRERFQSLIKDRYPQLLTASVQGMPVVTVLFDLYGDIVRSELEISSRPASELAVSESNFSCFEVTHGELLYVGASTVQTPANTVLVVYGGEGSRELDRALVQRFFPQLLTQGAPLNEGIWILFDQEGRVLKRGEEHFEPDRLREILEKRYPGIKTSDMTTTPVVGADGQPVKDSNGWPLKLTCVWLARGSPLPKS